MLRRATLAELKAALEHPEVLPLAAPGCDAVDVSGFSGIAFGDAAGVIIVNHISDNVWQWHWVLTPAVRGKAALDFAKIVRDALFTQFGACAIQGAVPRGHRAARLMNWSLGARPVGECVSPSGRDCLIYRLERTQWNSLVQASASSAA